MNQIPDRNRRIAISVLRVLLGLTFLTIGVAKLTGTLNTPETFEEFGWGQWFRYLTGGLDLTGAVLVLAPRGTYYGAVLLTCTIGLAAVLSFSRPIDFWPAVSFTALAVTLVWLTRPSRLFGLPLARRNPRMNSKLPVPVPEIPVSDIAAAVAYYRTSLGFRLDWSAEALGLAGMSNGNCRLFLANEHFRKTSGNVGPTVTWLNLQNKEEVDELYRVWGATNARLISAPESKPWGLHEFTAADADGNLFRVFYDFATPDRAKDAEQPAP